MERLTLSLPSMYGDHHVIEVRRILSALPGVNPGSVYASAAWQRVEIEYDRSQTGAGEIRSALAARGYAEGTSAAYAPPVSSRTRQSTGFAAGPSAVEQFVEKSPAVEHAFGPCPGFEVLHPGDTHPADRDR